MKNLFENTLLDLHWMMVSSSYFSFMAVERKYTMLSNRNHNFFIMYQDTFVFLFLCWEIAVTVPSLHSKFQCKKIEMPLNLIPKNECLGKKYKNRKCFAPVVLK